MTGATIARRLASPLVLLAGVALIADAVASGAATLVLVVIVPVVTGTSALLAVGAVLVVLGVALLPFSLGTEISTGGRPDTGGAPPTEVAGGLILIGPVPIFLGSWKDGSARRYRAAVLAGAVLVVAAVVLFVVLAF